ncbi:M24 family metallopeptidase [Lacticaseibacillus mingshuiensis]|uniref:M24 family metallopeptidase n=1 Tax=Lacticaseibacillus mingshuiensis TaxID=2799574 RepID=A0ABW4CK29_9LACO|nr:Xaa-Pro peptidase family protein [Lacticaseibacillus mingshuiensis]
MTRLEKLQTKLAGTQIDALLVTDPVNVSYLTGFTGDESALLVAKDQSWFITDSRFTEQVKAQVTNSALVLQQHGLAAKAGELATTHGLSRVGFESETMTYAEFAKLPKQTEWVPTTNMVAELREVKDDEELALIKRAIAIAEAGYDHVVATIHPGMTELEVATDLDFFMRQQGASGTSFETIVASGARSAMPHGAATTKVIAQGDVVTLDWGAVYHGYVSDITRTFAVGEPDPKIREIYRVVYAANQKVKALMAPGVTGAAINALAHGFIDGAGYGQYFGHGTGHGIGLSIHEGPGAWGPYRDVPQAIGNVETNEPGIYLPEVGGVRIEDDLLITATGATQLTREAPAEIPVIAVR